MVFLPAAKAPGTASPGGRVQGPRRQPGAEPGLPARSSRGCPGPAPAPSRCWGRCQALLMAETQAAEVGAAKAGRKTRFYLFIFDSFSSPVSELTSNCSPGAGLLPAANVPGSRASRRALPTHTAWTPTPRCCSAPGLPRLCI